MGILWAPLNYLAYHIQLFPTVNHFFFPACAGRAELGVAGKRPDMVRFESSLGHRDRFRLYEYDVRSHSEERGLRLVLANF